MIDSGVPAYWASGGDLMTRDAGVGGRVLGRARAAQLRDFYRGQVAIHADSAARAFCRRRAAELDQALRDLGHWRRASGPLQRQERHPG